MLHEVLGYAKRELRLPEVVAQRCVHDRIASASCRRCVEACPRGAWRLDDDMLGIDAEQCDGCGVCASVCTEGALLHEHRLLPRYRRSQLLAIAACEQAGVHDRTGVIPCLHSTGLRDLLHLYNQGCNTLVVVRGDCDHCERRPVARLEDALHHANQLLMSRELPTMELKLMRPAQWQTLLEKTGPEESGRGMSRRSFLGQAVRGGLAEGARAAGLATTRQEDFQPPGTLLGGGATAHLMPVVPAIDAGRCDGCDACANLCPHGALTLQAGEPDGDAYRIEAAACTGCGICTDVCESGAVSLSYIAPSLQRAVALRSGQCRRCGAAFHVPEHHEGDSGLCRVCTRVNHHRNLFQVLD